MYWIYGFKRGAFWPFVPIGEQKRDNANELELKAKLEHELPIEPDLTRWLALFDAPCNGTRDRDEGHGPVTLPAPTAHPQLGASVAHVASSRPVDAAQVKCLTPDGSDRGTSRT